MGKLASLGFRSGTPVPAWPSILKANSIPERFLSPYNQKGRGTVGLGYVKAVTALLMDTIILGTDPARYALTVGYRSGGEPKLVGSESDKGGRSWLGDYSFSVPARLILAEALAFNLHADVEADFRTLYEKIKGLLGTPWPYAEQGLASISRECDNEMMKLCDSMYFAVEQLERTDEVSFLSADIDPLPITNLKSLIEPTPNPVQPPTTGTLTARLKRLFARGGATMLLSGPSASFKSTFVRQAAVDATASLYIVQGTRSIEPIDLLGSVQVVNGDTRWVDGPVAQAFRKAQSEQAVLLIDEAMRLEPENLNALIPMLDRIPAAILPSMGITPVSDEPHFVLRLPEELIPAPCSRLSVALTTNLGAGFYQPGEGLDGALETRIRYKFHLERPGRDVTESIYRAVLDEDRVIESLYTLEMFTSENLERDGGLFRDSLNVTTNLAFLEEVAAELGDGVSVSDAFFDTAVFTLAPAICPRDDYGRLEDAAFRTFMDQVKRVRP